MSTLEYTSIRPRLVCVSKTPDPKIEQAAWADITVSFKGVELDTFKGGGYSQVACALSDGNTSTAIGKPADVCDV